MDLCWEKIIVSVTYQREGVEIKNRLTSLKLSVSSFLCAPPAVLQPLYGFYFNQYEMIKERANWVQLSEVGRFLVNSFDICEVQRLHILHFEDYATMPMLIFRA